MLQSESSMGPLCTAAFAPCDETTRSWGALSSLVRGLHQPTPSIPPGPVVNADARQMALRAARARRERSRGSSSAWRLLGIRSSTVFGNSMEFGGLRPTLLTSAPAKNAAGDKQKVPCDKDAVKLRCLEGKSSAATQSILSLPLLGSFSTEFLSNGLLSSLQDRERIVVSIRPAHRPPKHAPLRTMRHSRSMARWYGRIRPPSSPAFYARRATSRSAERDRYSILKSSWTIHPVELHPRQLDPRDDVVIKSAPGILYRESDFLFIEFSIFSGLCGSRTSPKVRLVDAEALGPLSLLDGSGRLRNVFSGGGDPPQPCFE
ncbi:hypothetical protein B0H11DRAFT_1949025 [Mycena galericulata]|nr:hypothetical protein B0H11DRAFT_1949025 [Mycena galericulata]